MKAIVIENNYKESITHGNCGWYFLADSAVSNTGKPFYLPENVGRVTASISLAIKISRLGKFIEPRFASRYYVECAPAVHFRLPEFKEKLRSEGLPEDAARSFDKSLFVGDFFPWDSSIIIDLWKNGIAEVSFSPDKLIFSVDEVLSKVSVMNTVKIGDLLIPGLNGELELNEGDILDLRSAEDSLFKVKIK